MSGKGDTRRPTDETKFRDNFAAINWQRPKKDLCHCGKPIGEHLYNDDHIPAPRLAGKTFLHTGDLGDIIAALPTIRQLGGGHLVISPPDIGRGNPRESLRGARFDAIRPLLMAQPYITGVEWSDSPKDITHDFSHFRSIPWEPGENLAFWQARYLGLKKLNLAPWLSVSAPNGNRVIAARSSRYHNPHFPWKLISEKYRDQLLFIGMFEEHLAFQELVGRQVEHAYTPTLLNVAEVIAASTLGFYNQSSPFWIAAGLGKRLVQESLSFYGANSIVHEPHMTYTYHEYELSRVINALNRLP